MSCNCNCMLQLFLFLHKLGGDILDDLVEDHHEDADEYRRMLKQQIKEDAHTMLREWNSAVSANNTGVDAAVAIDEYGAEVELEETATAETTTATATAPAEITKMNYGVEDEMRMIFSHCHYLEQTFFFIYK